MDTGKRWLGIQNIWHTPFLYSMCCVLSHFSFKKVTGISWLRSSYMFHGILIYLKCHAITARNNLIFYGSRIACIFLERFGMSWVNDHSKISGNWSQVFEEFYVQSRSIIILHIIATISSSWKEPYIL